MFQSLYIGSSFNEHYNTVREASEVSIPFISGQVVIEICEKYRVFEKVSN